ncbi:hypothetical protein COCNU_10G001310 [Cocos nucifera]|uniref:Uncharacterized protein n=1 Tax=Cocos nucifera TaxID=13894 RepID=A0A8K0ILS7_COCNU|nr:hypothetical protein COCNU_10G001310 [Cocos nucifera]
MEKLLAMSILSSGPDFSGDGKASGWFNSSWIGKKKNNKEEENRGGSVKSSTVDVQAKKKLEQQQQGKSRPRFAVELDGLHCFETIVPQ